MHFSRIAVIAAGTSTAVALPIVIPPLITRHHKTNTPSGMRTIFTGTATAIHHSEIEPTLLMNHNQTSTLTSMSTVFRGPATHIVLPTTDPHTILLDSKNTIPPADANEPSSLTTNILSPNDTFPLSNINQTTLSATTTHHSPKTHFLPTLPARPNLNPREGKEEDYFGVLANFHDNDPNCSGKHTSLVFLNTGLCIPLTDFASDIVGVNWGAGPDADECGLVAFKDTACKEPAEDVWLTGQDVCRSMKTHGGKWGSVRVGHCYELPPPVEGGRDRKPGMDWGTNGIGPGRK